MRPAIGRRHCPPVARLGGLALLAACSSAGSDLRCTAGLPDCRRAGGAWQSLGFNFPNGRFRAGDAAVVLIFVAVTLAFAIPGLTSQRAVGGCCWTVSLAGVRRNAKSQSAKSGREVETAAPGSRTRRSLRRQNPIRWCCRTFVEHERVGPGLFAEMPIRPAAARLAGAGAGDQPWFRRDAGIHLATHRAQARRIQRTGEGALRPIRVR